MPTINEVARTSCNRFMPSILSFCTMSLAMILTTTVQGAVPSYLTSENPAPASVTDSKSPMEQAFTMEQEAQGDQEEQPRALKDTEPFFRDSTLTLLPRLYSLQRDRDDTSDLSTTALGGRLEYRSGWWKERIKLGASLFTSQKLQGDRDKDGSLLLKPGQKPITVLGEAYLKARLSDKTWLKLYRQSLDVPYVNRQDSRMLPNTFEAYTLFSEAPDNLVFGLSHVTKIKKRNSDKFVSMSKAAGLDGSNKPLTMIGARYDFPNRDITIGAVNQYAWEFMNNFYGEITSKWAINDDVALKLSAQYTDQQSVGDERAGDFDTSVFGAKAAISLHNATFAVAFSTTEDDAGIRSPYGGYPGYLSIIINDFNRAGEDAWLVGFAYDFADIGVPGLSTFINYAEGDTPNSGSNASADQEEFNITFDYRFKDSQLDGLWIRARGAVVDRDSGFGAVTREEDFRLIVNYEIPIL